MKRLACFGVVLAVTLGVIASAASARSGSDGGFGSCPKGSKPAVVGGNFKCLRLGARCKGRYQAAYKKYGFVCVAGHLRKKVVHQPPPPPEPPPAPPPPPAPVAIPGHYKGLTSQLTNLEFDVTANGGVTHFVTGQINQGCSPNNLHIFGNEQNGGSFTVPIGSDGSWVIDATYQSSIDNTYPSANHIKVTGHMNSAVGSGNLELSTTFNASGTAYTCDSGLVTWNVTRTG